MELKGCMEDSVKLASCEHHFIRVHGKLVQHPSNNKSILLNEKSGFTSSLTFSNIMLYINAC